MEPADFYTGIVADAYGHLKSSSFGAGLYRDFVVTHGQPGLEIGCGDGAPLLDLRAEGLDVEGVDSSTDMLERCHANALRRNIEVRLHHQRVEDLALDRRYPSIYFAGPTFTLLPDDETARKALLRIHQHLTDDGIALIPLWVPAPTPTGELGVSRGHDDGLGVEVRFTPVSETSDPVGRTRVTSCRYERITSIGTEVSEREWIIHWQTPSSFRRLCRETGLAVVDLVDDDTGETAIDSSTSFTATVSTEIQRAQAGLLDSGLRSEA